MGNTFPPSLEGKVIKNGIRVSQGIQLGGIVLALETRKWPIGSAMANFPSSVKYIKETQTLGKEESVVNKISIILDYEWYNLVCVPQNRQKIV